MSLENPALGPPLPLNLYKIRAFGGSHLARVHIHESGFPTTSHSISTKSGPLEGPILVEWEESWF